MKVAEKNRLAEFNGVAIADRKKSIQIAAPDIREAVFEIVGTAPLVIHRFSAKAKVGLADKQSEGKSSGSKKKREATRPEDVFNEARYISPKGWDGFHAASIRKAMISACRLVDFKMTLAKLSIFVVADGADAKEPQIPLIRIYGKAVMQEDVGRVANGNPYVIYRPAYHGWSAKVRIRWDADQFTLQDISHLLARVGQQVGIGEGRHDSKESAGMGWGTFDIASK